MMRFLIPLVIILVGIGGGGAAGYFLRPKPPEPAKDCVCEQGVEAGEHGAAAGHEGEGGPEVPPEYTYVNLKNQFVVPVIENQKMTGMVVMSLSLEASPGSNETIYAKEPKLRDEFLRLLFAYSTIGGFGGNYLESSDLKVIRDDLTMAAKNVLGPVVNQVLIVDLVRQDL